MIGTALSRVNVVAALYTQIVVQSYTQCKNPGIEASAATIYQLLKLSKGAPEVALATSNVKEKIAPFPDLRSAGGELAAAFPRDGTSSDLVVLAIASAGVPVAVEVAKHLESALDLIIIRRLLAPRGPGSQACAVNVAGNLVVDEEIGPRPVTPQTPFDYFREDALNGLASRAQVCRGERPPIDLAEKPLLIVDCGIRTSLTMQAAIGAVRTLSPAHVTAAVPVTSVDGLRVVEALVDEFIYLAAPEPFGNAGMWYKDFSRPADDAVSQLLSPTLSESFRPE